MAAHAETIVHRDLLDLASEAGQITVRLDAANKALTEAYEGDCDEARRIAWALENLREARGLIAALIADVEAA